MLNDSLYSSQTGDWETPCDLFSRLHTEFNFDLDPACTVMTAKCKRIFTEREDGLKQTWFGNVFLNPPYGRIIATWMRKVMHERQNCETIVCLIPVRSDSRWWHASIMQSAEIRFLSRRLTFAGAGNKAPFPAAIAVFDKATCKPTVSTYWI